MTRAIPSLHPRPSRKSTIALDPAPTSNPATVSWRGLPFAPQLFGLARISSGALTSPLARRVVLSHGALVRELYRNEVCNAASSAEALGLREVDGVLSIAPGSQLIIGTLLGKALWGIRLIDHAGHDEPASASVGLLEHIDELPRDAAEAFSAAFYAPHALSVKELRAIERLKQAITRGTLRYDPDGLRQVLLGDVAGMNGGRLARRRRLAGSGALAKAVFGVSVALGVLLFRAVAEGDPSADQTRIYSLITKLPLAVRFLDFFLRILPPRRGWRYMIVPIKQHWATAEGLQHRLPQYYEGVVVMVAVRDQAGRER